MTAIKCAVWKRAKLLQPHGSRASGKPGENLIVWVRWHCWDRMSGRRSCSESAHCFFLLQNPFLPWHLSAAWRKCSVLTGCGLWLPVKLLKSLQSWNSHEWLLVTAWGSCPSTDVCCDAAQLITPLKWLCSVCVPVLPGQMLQCHVCFPGCGTLHPSYLPSCFLTVSLPHVGHDISENFGSDYCGRWFFSTWTLRLRT